MCLNGREKKPDQKVVTLSLDFLLSGHLFRVHFPVYISTHIGSNIHMCAQSCRVETVLYCTWNYVGYRNNREEEEMPEDRWNKTKTWQIAWPWVFWTEVNGLNCLGGCVVRRMPSLAETQMWHFLSGETSCAAQMETQLSRTPLLSHHSLFLNTCQDTKQH